MLGRPMVQVASSATRTIAVFAVIAVLGFLSSVGVGVRLLAGTLVAIGGNSNPTSISMIQELGGDPRPLGFNPGSVGVDGKGYLDPANPDSPYFGYDFENVPWPSQIPFTSGWDGKTSFEQSQRQGLLNVQDALNPLLDPTLNPEDPVAVAGYSSGANVVVREMRYLQSIGSPDADRLEFLLIASMNRPNGGIGQRFPGLFVPFFNVRFDGSTPTDTPYKTTDVSWEYDPISDFPNYPLNFLADLNALVGFGLLHANYFPADMTGPRVRPDVTVGNITYVTLTAPELPLVAALKMLGVPKQLRDLVEPALKVLVDLGYDRSISPGVATPASLSPTPQRLLALPVKLLNAVGVGIRHALNPSWDKPSSDTAPAVSDETTDKTPVAATALPQAKTTTNALTASSAQKAAPKTAAGEADTADEVKKVTVAGAATEGAPDEAAAETPAATEKPSGDAAQPARRQPSRTPRPHRVKTPAAVDSTTPADATAAGPAPTAGGGKHAAPDKTDAAGDRAPRHAAGHGNDAGSDKKAA
ncbi:MAG: PE-PPE domain-containing protein [Mycolicibacterium cosmeticum]|nr:PE-PPE domain-containing protein [Mycolicibacterium cosmeticum]